MTETASRSGRPQEPTKFSQPSDVENEVSRLFRAPREKVFRVFTDPQTVAYVWSPDPGLVTVETLEFRPGGRYVITVRGKDGGLTRFHGEFLEIDPPHRVVNTWHVSTLPGVEAIETDRFESEGDRTRVTIRWKFASREARDKMGGAEAEAAAVALWNNVDKLLESLPSQSA